MVDAWACGAGLWWTPGGWATRRASSTTAATPTARCRCGGPTPHTTESGHRHAPLSLPACLCGVAAAEVERGGLPPPRHLRHQAHRQGTAHPTTPPSSNAGVLTATCTRVCTSTGRPSDVQLLFLPLLGQPHGLPLRRGQLRRPAHYQGRSDTQPTTSLPPLPPSYSRTPPLLPQPPPSANTSPEEQLQQAEAAEAEAFRAAVQHKARLADSKPSSLASFFHARPEDEELQRVRPRPPL